MNLIYIAGAYTGTSFADTFHNISIADSLGREVVSRFGKVGQGVMVSIPHNNTPLHWDGIQDPEWFYGATMELLKRCDAMIYVPGDEGRSVGTKNEIEHCKKTGKSYFRGDGEGFAEFRQWLKTQS